MNLSGLRVLLASIAMGVVLGGCASIAPDVGDMTRAYAESVEKHERNQILKNLLRAGDGIPMSFTAVPTIVGTGQLEGNVGVAGKLFGELFSNATSSPSLRSSRGFNFTLASLDNERFTTAFLRDLSLDTVQVFSTGDFHRQLLFTLVVDSVSFNLGRSNEQVIENGTSSQARFDRFQSALAGLIDSGLTTERVTRSEPIGIDLTREELLTDRRFFGSDLVSDRSVRVVRVATSAGDRYRVVRQVSGVRFCLSPQAYEKRTGLGLSPSLACRPLHQATGGPVGDDEAADHASFLIDIRSAREVYRFVGRLAMSQIRQSEWIPSINLPQRQAGIVAGSHPLIVLRKGLPAANEKVLAVAEHMGSNYYVPFEDSGFSARVFEYLALLLSISMVKDAIPAQPAILVR